MSREFKFRVYSLVIWPAEPYDDLGCMLIEYVTVIGNVFENPKMRGIYE